jgi:hypothetical protein
MRLEILKSSLQGATLGVEFMAAGNHYQLAERTIRPEAAEEQQELVERVLRSRCFEKSARLREFLTFVCQRAPGADIHEQEIGCAVFGRSLNYDTSVDNIVRVNASQLRKKLEQYFAGDGAAERLVLTIPKGRYVPEFQERPPEPVSAEAPVAPEAPGGWLENRRIRMGVLGLAALAPILAVVCLAMALNLRQPRAQTHNELESNPNLNALWSQLIRKDMRTDVVVTDSSLGLIQDLIGHSIPLADYVHPDVWGQAEELKGRPEAQAAARLAARRHYTSFANVNLARRILALAGEDQARIGVHFAREFGARQMKADNVILLGSVRANPWVELIEGQMNFRFGFDGKSRRSYFENRHPKPGEPATYANDNVVSYCRVAFLPNLDRTGNILAISGTEMEGTEVGGEFLTSEKWISNLRRFISLDRNGRFPSFEVLLRANKIAGPASGFEVVACRTAQ